MFLLKPLQLIFNSLTQDDSPRQMSAGFVLGAIAGLIPKTSLLSHILLISICVFNVNMAAAGLATLLFSIIAPIADPITHRIGYLLLVDLSFLKPLWTFLYNVPVLPWTEFNHTTTLGSFVFGLLFAYPLFLVSGPLFMKYKSSWGGQIKKYKLVQILSGAEKAQKYLD